MSEQSGNIGTVSHNRRHSGGYTLSRPDAVWIYAVQAGEFVKIGIAGRLLNRVSGIQTGCPLKVELLDAAEVWKSYATTIEGQLHKMHAARRVRGEWFAMTPAEGREVIAYVRARHTFFPDPREPEEPVCPTGGVSASELRLRQLLSKEGIRRSNQERRERRDRERERVRAEWFASASAREMAEILDGGP